MSKSSAPTPTVKQFRHRAEVPLVVMGGLLSLGAIIIAIAIAASGGEEPGWLKTSIAAIIMAPILMALVVLRFNYWKNISNAVEVTDKQFPELHKVFKDLAMEIGMTPDGKGMNKIPRLYVLNGNGVMNAYASKCQVYKGYVVIYSDLLDVAYTYKHWDAMRFILAHELGHIKCGHVSIWRALVMPVARLLMLDKSITRAQEYTADRHGGYYAPEGALGLLALFAGKHMGEHVDADAYFESVSNHKDGFWLKVANFKADHAVGFRRMAALKRVQAEGWDVHGRML